MLKSIGKIKDSEQNSYVFVENDFRVISSPREQAWVFVTIYVWRRSRGDAEAVVRKRPYHDFWAYRWGRVTKMKKIAFSLERCRKSDKSRSHAAWRSKTKKRLPCSMGVRKLIFATPLERERRFQKLCNFDCCEFCWNLGGQKVCKTGRPVRFCILITFW